MQRWMVQIAATGTGSLLLLVALLYLGADHAFGALLLPVAWIGTPIAQWIDAMWPPQGGTWPAGIATAIMVDAVLVWLYLWLLLLFVLRLPLRFKEKTR